MKTLEKIRKEPKGNLFVTSGWYVWSTTKAGNIAGCITVCTEVNPKITQNTIRPRFGLMRKVQFKMNLLLSKCMKS
jgi:hypothetical protein